MLSVLMQVFVVFSLIIVLWAVYGYSIAFTEGGAFFGGMDRLLLGGIFSMKDGVGSFTTAATFSKGVVIPELLYVAFQATFAAITVCLIVGAFAERIKFSAVLLFAVIWFTFAYLPIAHMVWFWPGPDAFTDAKAAELATSKAGWLFQKGALDFAGGTVVHINAGIAGLVGAYVIGKRVGYGKEAMAPHNLTFTMVGASLLWVGWFGFNAGSALEAGDIAGLAFVNTLIATAGAVLTWTLGEWMAKGKPSMLGAASGAVAGLVAITPACGFVGTNGALILGLPVGRQWIEAPAGRRRCTRRVRSPRRRRDPGRAHDWRVRGAEPRRPGRVRLRRRQGKPRLFDHRTSDDTGHGGRHDAGVVRHRRLRRLQDCRPGHRAARFRGRGTRGPGHQFARRVGLPDVGIASKVTRLRRAMRGGRVDRELSFPRLYVVSPQWLFGAPLKAPRFFSSQSPDPGIGARYLRRARGCVAS
jgi:ammonium transporter